jgi:uncharacterized membrane protein
MTESKSTKIETMELILAKLLRVGSVIAAALLGAGMLAAMAGFGTEVASQLINIGLIVLVSTPVMRVTVAMLVFLWERDLIFAFFCLVVLVSLGVGMLIGKVE